jgi:hypothetical protein
MGKKTLHAAYMDIATHLNTRDIHNLGSGPWGLARLRATPAGDHLDHLEWRFQEWLVPRLPEEESVGDFERRAQSFGLRYSVLPAPGQGVEGNP